MIDTSRFKTTKPSSAMLGLSRWMGGALNWMMQQVPPVLKPRPNMR